MIKAIIIDDEPRASGILELMIERFVPEIERVWCCNDARQAAALIHELKPDLVFMDIKMPVMDGYTAARLIHEFNPGQKIVAQTAYEGDRNIAKQNGCIDFIAKPFTRQHLLSVIKAHI